jgi:hypothetical protein
MFSKKLLGALTASCAALFTAAPAHAALVVLSGVLDNLQVVAPVIDPNTGEVIGSTHFRPDGVTPVSLSTARGFATVTVDTVAQTVTTDLSWIGLTGVADRSHLHDAPADHSRLEPPNDRFFHEVINEEDDHLENTVIGGMVECGPDLGPGVFCAPATGSLHDFLILDDSRYDPTNQFGGFRDFDALLAAFINDGVFLDLHTWDYQGGEIRGQLIYANTIPEPSSTLLLGLGLLALGLTARTRRA